MNSKTRWFLNVGFSSPHTRWCGLKNTTDVCITLFQFRAMLWFWNNLLLSMGHFWAVLEEHLNAFMTPILVRVALLGYLICIWNELKMFWFSDVEFSCPHTAYEVVRPQKSHWFWHYGAALCCISVKCCGFKIYMMLAVYDMNSKTKWFLNVGFFQVCIRGGVVLKTPLSFALRCFRSIPCCD